MADAIEADTQAIIDAIVATRVAISAPVMAAFLDTRVHEYLAATTEERFAHEVSPDGVAWAPLTETTNIFREAQGFPAEHPINVRTGSLLSWLTEPGFIEDLPTGPSMITPDPATAGDWLGRKLETAQTGARATAARPVIGLTLNDADAIVLLLQEFFLSTTAAMGVHYS